LLVWAKLRRIGVLGPNFKETNKKNGLIMVSKIKQRIEALPSGNLAPNSLSIFGHNKLVWFFKRLGSNPSSYQKPKNITTMDHLFSTSRC